MFSKEILSVIYEQRNQLKEIECLNSEINLLQENSNYLQNYLAEIINSDKYNQFNYLVYEDLKQFCGKSDLIAIRAPLETNIDQPDPKSIEILSQTTFEVI